MKRWYHWAALGLGLSQMLIVLGAIFIPDLRPMAQIVIVIWVILAGLATTFIR